MLYSTYKKDKKLRFLIFLFFFLIIFDGVFRKWIFPSSSSAIIGIKIFIAIIITFCGVKYWRYLGFWEISFAIIGIVVFTTTLIWGHGNIIVDIYGCLPYWFCLPVCVIISRVINRHDLINICKLSVYTSIINSILVIAQFLVLPTNILNYTSGEVDERIANIPVYLLSGMFRPSGIFIYNNGNSSFTLIALSFTLYFLFINTKVLSKSILITSLILIFCNIYCSVSRTLFFYCGFIIVYFLILFFNKTNYKKIIWGLVVTIPIFLFIINSKYGKLANSNINNRFAEASEVQYTGSSTLNGTIKDIYDRNIKYNIKAIINPRTINGDIPPEIGYGQGMSTQIGSHLLDIKKNSGFALAEWDGLRIACESGPALGLIIIFLRLGYFLRFFKRINRKNKNSLSLILYPSFTISFFLSSTWGNAFNLCFASAIGGLYIASIISSNTSK